MRNVVLLRTILLCSVFLLGVFSGIAIATNTLTKSASPRAALAQEKATFHGPQDRVQQQDIQVYAEKTVLNVKNILHAPIKDTGSMEPTLTGASHSLEVQPQSPKEVGIGDIISYKTTDEKGNTLYVSHRVTGIVYDQGEIKFETRGDANEYKDKELVSFNQIEGVFIGVLY